MIVRTNAIRGTVCRGNVRRVTVLKTNVAAYWKNGDIEAFAKKLSQRLANNMILGKGGQFMLGIIDTQEPCHI